MTSANVFTTKITVVSDISATIIEPMDSSHNINIDIYLGHLHEFHYVSLIIMVDKNNC